MLIDVGAANCDVSCEKPQIQRGREEGSSSLIYQPGSLYYYIYFEATLYDVRNLTFHPLIFVLGGGCRFFVWVGPRCFRPWMEGRGWKIWSEANNFLESWLDSWGKNHLIIEQKNSETLPGKTWSPGCFIFKEKTNPFGVGSRPCGVAAPQFLGWCLNRGCFDGVMDDSHPKQNGQEQLVVDESIFHVLDPPFLPPRVLWQNDQNDNLKANRTSQLFQAKKSTWTGGGLHQWNLRLGLLPNHTWCDGLATGRKRAARRTTLKGVAILAPSTLSLHGSIFEGWDQSGFALRGWGKISPISNSANGLYLGAFMRFFSLSVFWKASNRCGSQARKKTLLPFLTAWVEVAANRYRGTTGIAAHVEDPVSFGPFGDGFGWEFDHQYQPDGKKMKMFQLLIGISHDSNQVTAVTLSPIHSPGAWWSMLMTSRGSVYVKGTNLYIVPQYLYIVTCLFSPKIWISKKESQSKFYL